MKLYIGCKIIEAEPVTNRLFDNRAKGTPVSPAVEPDVPGYLVRYPDGYESWSPKDVFESAYRLVTVGERDLLNSAAEKG